MSGHYSHKGLYNSYDKNHKERDALDYYATPPAEVTNILNHLSLDFNNCSILEPCVGGGHMVQGINEYIKHMKGVTLLGSDIKDRGFKDSNWNIQYGLDFFTDDYPINEVDYVIMNPPYGVIEPFMLRALDIAKHGCLMLARLQVLEGDKRFEKVWKDYLPSQVWVYIDRIQCYKNGDFSIKGSSAQAYCWVYWDKDYKKISPELHWIRRAK